MHNALSIFVTEWYHLAGLGLPSGLNAKYESRVVANINRTLEFLGSLQTKATFFVLGIIAEKHPDMVKKIEIAGHEVACLGYRYREIFDQTRFSFRDELKKSKETLERIVGNSVLGYTASDFSLTEKTEWAIDILVEEGIKYDCSIIPIRHARYGIPSAPRVNYRLRKNLIEFPPSTIRFPTGNVSIAGGGAFKLWPYFFIKASVKNFNKNNIAAHIYFHVWELDDQCPGVKMPFLRRFLDHADARSVKPKMTRLLSDFQFVPVWSVLEKTIAEDEVL